MKYLSSLSILVLVSCSAKKEINSKRILNEYMINESQKRLVSTETKKNGNSVLDKLNSIKLN